MTACLHRTVERAADRWLCVECGKEFVPDHLVAEIVTERTNVHDIAMRAIRDTFTDALEELIRRTAGERSNR